MKSSTFVPIVNNLDQSLLYKCRKASCGIFMKELLEIPQLLYSPSARLRGGSSLHISKDELCPRLILLASPLALADPSKDAHP